MSLQLAPPRIANILESGTHWTPDARDDVRVWLNEKPQLGELERHCQKHLGHGATHEDAKDAWKDFDANHLGRNIDVYDPGRGLRFQGWLLLLLAQFCWREGAKLRRRAAEPLERNNTAGEAVQLDVSDPSTETELDLVNQLDLDRGRPRLQRCLGSLKPLEREVIVLTYFGERSDNEISQRLGITLVHVRVIRFRALQRLRRCIQELSPRQL